MLFALWFYLGALAVCHRFTVPNGGETKIESSISRLAVFIYTKRQSGGGGEPEVGNAQLD